MTETSELWKFQFCAVFRRVGDAGAGSLRGLDKTGISDLADKGVFGLHSVVLGSVWREDLWCGM